jgi:predicted transposase/invertase (TIGR01784 family)
MTESITQQSLEKLQLEHPMIPLTFDKMLKAFFENNPDIFKMFIISVVHLDLLKEEIELEIKNTELPVSHYKEYRKTIDFNVDINKNILLNIELNKSYFENVKIRNHFYKSKKISMNLKQGDDIKRIKELKNIQLNLNVKDKSTTLGEDIVVPYSIITNTIYVNNDITYIRYLDYYRILYYNGDVELTEDEYWLALLTAENYVELNEMASKFLNDEIREKLVKEVIRLSNDELVFDEYEQMMGDKLIEYEEQQSLLKEGFNNGLQVGIEQKELEMIERMLKNNVDYEIISKISEKAIEEIKEIEKSI